MEWKRKHLDLIVPYNDNHSKLKPYIFIWHHVVQAIWCMACQHFPFILCRFNTIIHSGSLPCRGPFQLEIPSRQYTYADVIISLQWRHNGRDGVSNHQPHHCLLNRLFRRRSEKSSKLRVTGLCVWNSPVTGEFPEQMASNAENVSILITSSCEMPNVNQNLNSSQWGQLTISQHWLW